MTIHSLELPTALRNPEFRFIKLGSEGQRLKVPIEAGWNILGIDELKSYIEKKAIQWDTDKVSGKHSGIEAKGKRVSKRPEFRGKLNKYTYDDPEFQEWLKKGKNYGVTVAGGLIRLESDQSGKDTAPTIFADSKGTTSIKESILI